jgi:hypothetical protein
MTDINAEFAAIAEHIERDQPHDDYERGRRDLTDAVLGWLETDGRLNTPLTEIRAEVLAFMNGFVACARLFDGAPPEGAR